ncbi:MAG: hypothetical protein K1X78_15925 [Verrucomicrobiaceae bacterium]|nr:hypothetical protein [Verrucomicrobiaceae bacterium]
MSHRFRFAILSVIVLLFAARNLPWNLDDYDQAKQAWTSYEIVRHGHWWFQHTPQDAAASKPPLAGWCSVVFYWLLGGWWDGAWRLPSFLCALLMLWLLFRDGSRVDPQWGGMLAAGAFGLTMMTPRLATLVRTDMMLAFWIFLAGRMIWQHVRDARAWTRRERWCFCAVILASMFTKGPAACLFVLPGLAFMKWHHLRTHAAGCFWPGWWPWLLPLAVMAAWAGAGCVADAQFYQQVVLKEFLGRVTGGHKSQPVWFYATHLLHKFAPWSVLLLVLMGARRVRDALKADPSLLWLAAWIAGGFVVMSLIPSKRPDRIFPVIAPLCLLLPALLARWGAAQAGGKWPPVRCARLCLLIAAVSQAGYAAFTVGSAYRADEAALVRFCSRVRDEAARLHVEFGVCDALDEGIIIYAGKDGFIPATKAVAAFGNGSMPALILPEKLLNRRKDQLGALRVLDRVPRLPATADGYVFAIRAPERRGP